MKKNIFALIAVLCFALFCITACGGGASNAPAAAGADNGGGETAAAETTAAAAGETFDVGNFTLELPAGWKAFPQSDIFGEQDEDGNYPIDESSIYVSKDAKDDWELFSSPYVYITYTKPEVTILSARDNWYENTEDLDITIDGATIDEAYSGDSTVIDDWSYEIIRFSTENGQFQVTIPTNADGKETGYSVSDPEIMTIINSIAAK